MKPIGIDIGNIRGACVSMQSGSCHMCMSTANSVTGMPTSAYIGRNGEILVAEKNRRNEAFRVDTIKRHMQSGREIVRTNGAETRRAVSDDIYTEIVRALLRQGKDEIDSITDDQTDIKGLGAVICYPSAFSDEPELLERMSTAAGKAADDIRILGMIPESGAAGIAYLDMIRKRAEKSKGVLPESITIALLDIGGGTSDAAIVTAQMQDPPYKLLLHDGIQDFGGKDIDDLFYEDTIMSLERELKNTQLSTTEKYNLRDQIIRAKEELSTQDTYPITMNIGSYGDIHEHTVTRERLEYLSRGGILRVTGLLESLLERAAAEKIPIDTIVLTGGVSRMPLVRECVEELVRQKHITTGDGREMSVDIFDPSWSVAKGAAIYAVGRKRIMEQRTRHNYCFRQADKNGIEHFTLCIPYAKALPAKSRPLPMTRIGNRLEVSIAYDETGKEINTREGEEADPSRMKEFRRFYFDEASGDVTFAVDENMMLTVTLQTKDGKVISRSTGRLKGEKAYG